MKEFEQILLAEIDRLIEENTQNTNFQISDLTDALDISRTKLHRIVLKLTELPPNKYIIKKRLEKAKEILEDGEYPTVKETALAVGFNTPSYFSNLFYETYQITPYDLLKS